MEILKQQKALSIKSPPRWARPRAVLVPRTGLYRCTVLGTQHRRCGGVERVYTVLGDDGGPWRSRLDFLGLFSAALR